MSAQRRSAKLRSEDTAPATRRKRPARPRRTNGVKRSGSRVWRVLAWMVGVPLVGAALFFLTLPDVARLKTRVPESTALIDARAAEAREHGRAARRAQRVVPLAQISPWLVHAVVDSEDARFYQHGAIDFVETEDALERAANEGKLGRGASTITQQLAKNLWLGEQRSLWRKAREAAMAERLETLGKDRVLELYLNVVEWGDGIYGAEAASQRWFGVHARELTPEQAAVLTAMLPAPRKRNPRRPSQKLKRRAAEVLELLGTYKQLPPAELAAARARLHAMLGEWAPSASE